MQHIVSCVITLPNFFKNQTDFVIMLSSWSLRPSLGKTMICWQHLLLWKNSNI